MTHGHIGRMTTRVLATAAAVAVLALGACERNSVDDLLQKAEASRDAGNIRTSMIQLKNAIQKDPQNARARLLLGQTFLDLGDGAQAEIELKRARELGAPADRATALLLEAKLMQGQARAVAGEIPALDQQPPATRAAFLVLRAQTQLAAGQSAEAVQSYVAATTEDATALDAWIGLARVVAARGNMEGAQQHLARAVSIAPNDVKTLLLQGDLAAQTGKFEDAEKAFRAVLTKRKDDQTALRAQFGVAQALLSQNKTQEAIDRLTPVLKAAPRHPTPNYLRAFAAYRLKDYAAAKTHAETALQAQPTHRGALFIAGASNYALNQYEQALKHLSTFVQQVPDNSEGRKMLAATQMRLGDPKRAVGTLQPALTGDAAKDSRTLAMAGAAAAQAGDAAGARRYLADASAAATDAKERAEIGVTRVALGDVTGGVEDLESASKDTTDPAAVDLALISAHIRARDFDRAVEVARRLQERDPKNATGFNAEGVALTAKGDLAGARAAFGKALAVNPEDNAATRNLALLAVRDGDLDGARRLYDEILTRQPNDIQTLMQYGQLELQANRPEQAIARARQAVAAQPTAVVPRVALARVHLLRNEPAKALEVAQPILKDSGDNPAVLEIIGRSQLALGQSAEAAGTFRRLISVRPEAAVGYRFLASAYEADGRSDAALREIETALRIAPTDPSLRFDQARLLAQANRLEDAARITGELRAAYPNDPVIGTLEGAIALSTNRPDDAVAAYARVHAAQQNAQTLVNLARAQMAANRMADAEAALTEWIKRHPEDAGPRVLLADLNIRGNQLAKAEAEYRAVLRQAPNNVVVLNNLAWILMQTGRATDSLAYARRAVELAPEAPQIADTLGQALIKTGNAVEAVTVLRKAVEKAPTAQAIQVRLAEALIGAGDKAAAREVLQRVLADQRQTAERTQAEALLRGLGG